MAGFGRPTSRRSPGGGAKSGMLVSMNESIVVEPLSKLRIDDAAHVHAQAFAGYLNTRFGLRYTRAYFSWFVEHGESVALMAVDGTGRLCGYVVGVPIGGASGMGRHLLWSTSTGLLRHPTVVIDRRFWSIARLRIRRLVGRPVIEAAPPALPEPTMDLYAIGIVGSSRGKGHGQVLLAAFEAASRSRNAQSMRPSVYPENTAARRAYEAAGWLPHDGAHAPGSAMYYVKLLA